ncbi:class I SAM-dependent methyltransferase [Nocardia alni]|uniref:class I SAM-dependent methyltransferase n=1 Tax=Nocardia alni TaxID=2815723 RepID=UPI001C245ADA|nr:class I SAM-dependent methyltransferase [Nocardia alni]
MSGQPWDASYRDGPAPWDIGGPQPAVVRVAQAGGFTGTVLDAGCGSGENALFIAALGVDVVGVDVAATALALGREKAAERGLGVEFVEGDAFDLGRLGRRFDTVLDCGLFHSCDQDERPRYVASLASVTAPGASLYVLCFSDDGTELGPHPVSRDKVEAAFAPATGWAIADIGRDRIHTTFQENGVAAWLVTILRVGG